ncbi:hypothetical protein D7030_14445 [Flavobacteriaceae bacterium AU392]|nr:hypothetical protein D1817_04045 [Flavobacteriaceae bacterium]RKM81498.1 hypothetical protein D7030_14445 [Flavobacteriaceae bacterium AU392]
MKIYIGSFIAMLFSVVSLAQGPPITLDKIILLGSDSFTARTLIEYRNTERGNFVYIPFSLSYLPTSNTSIAIDIPFITYDFESASNGSGLADIRLTGKYQFYQKNATGKTFRVLAKTEQTLPTGEELDLLGLSTGLYQGYYGILTGYESLKFGITSELGYNWIPNGTLDHLRYKLGFGLPLLKPQFPNKQINLYFEYSNFWIFERNWYQLLYAQGIQYAGKDFTIDVSVQVPLVNDVDTGRELNYSLFLGGRYTF